MWSGSSLLCLMALISISIAEDHRELPKKIEGISTCNDFRAGLVKEYFNETTVFPSPDTDIKYCNGMGNTKQSDDQFDKKIDIDEVIAYYNSIPGVISYRRSLNDTEEPITSYAVRVVDGEIQLPLYINADIRHRHLLNDTDVIFGDDIHRQMFLMGKLECDDGGHLLAHTLGGNSRTMNIVPMAQNLNIELDYEESGVLRYYWNTHEKWILRFLQNYHHGRVAWTIVVQYDDNVIIQPLIHRYYRPLRFSIQYTAFTDQNDNSSIYYESPEMSYLNNNHFPCSYEQEHCNINYSNKPQGKVGHVTSMGSWQYLYQSVFPVVIDGKQYFYSQVNSTSYWFIQELLPGGQMGNETDNGFLNNTYPVVFPYSIKGKYFYYGYNPDEHNWFIRELLPGGKMGIETQKGKWIYKYDVCFPYTIDGKYYFYCHNSVSTAWFTQELLPNGLMGDQKKNGNWDKHWDVAFPFRINGRQFFYGHSNDTKEWFIRELLPAGRIGEVTSSGEWDSVHQVCFPFAMTYKQYFHCQSSDDGDDGNSWFIRELLPGGRMGNETETGYWDYKYQSQFPFMINGEKYFYFQTNSKDWMIQTLL